MTEFKREERYLVVKLDKLADDQGDGMSRKEAIYRQAHFGKALVDCVVIEYDWPIYEDVWAMVQRMAENRPQKQDELEALLQDAQWAMTKAEQERDEALEREQALSAHLEALSSSAIALAEACENKADLPLHKWAVKCAMQVSRVHKVVRDTPATSLARRDAETIAALNFPTMLRKRWSGGEVQQWLQDQANDF